MNDEDQDKFEEVWARCPELFNLAAWHVSKVKAAAERVFAAGMAHRDKRVAELEARMPLSKDGVRIPFRTAYQPMWGLDSNNEVFVISVTTQDQVGGYYSTIEAAEAARDATPQPEAEP